MRLFAYWAAYVTGLQFHKLMMNKRSNDWIWVEFHEMIIKIHTIKSNRLYCCIWLIVLPTGLFACSNGISWKIEYVRTIYEKNNNMATHSCTCKISKYNRKRIHILNIISKFIEWKFKVHTTATAVVAKKRHISDIWIEKQFNQNFL